MNFTTHNIPNRFTRQVGHKLKIKCCLLCSLDGLSKKTEILMTDKTAIKKLFPPHDHLNVGLISEYSYRYSYEYLDLLIKQTNCPFQYCSLVSQAEVEPTVLLTSGYRYN